MRPWRTSKRKREASVKTVEELVLVVRGENHSHLVQQRRLELVLSLPGGFATLVLGDTPVKIWIQDLLQPGSKHPKPGLGFNTIQGRKDRTQPLLHWSRAAVTSRY